MKIVAAISALLAGVTLAEDVAYSGQVSFGTSRTIGDYPEGFFDNLEDTETENRQISFATNPSRGNIEGYGGVDASTGQHSFGTAK